MEPTDRQKNNLNSFSSIPSSLGSITGSQLLSSIRPQPPFQTGHPSLDLLFNNRSLKRRHDPIEIVPPSLAGLSRRQHLQIEGPPGVGKTKVAIGIAVRARTASLITRRAEEVEVLYIDADGSAPARLFRESAQGVVEELQENRDGLTDRICDGIHLVRVTSTADLVFFFLRLSRWLIEHTKTKLIVLDSITAHTKYVSMTIEERALVGQHIREAIKLATTSFNCTVIMTTQPTKKAIAGNSILVTPEFRPSSAWSSLPSIFKLRMRFEPDGTRKAVVIEQDSSATALGRFKGDVIFEINSIGICEPGQSQSQA
ncbi:P-loop containing nucleoside triphosphate hydrolase protein [Melampsora americana]|nr:P-loop containing nucleoside triphosphate hydrolase protein [Melampsora americana]